MSCLHVCLSLLVPFLFAAFIVYVPLFILFLCLSWSLPLLISFSLRLLFVSLSVCLSSLSLVLLFRMRIPSSRKDRDPTNWIWLRRIGIWKCLLSNMRSFLALLTSSLLSWMLAQVVLSVIIISSTNQSINQSIRQSINQSINQSMNPTKSIDQSINLINQPSNQSLHHSLNQSISLSIKSTNHQSINYPTNQSIYQSIIHSINQSSSFSSIIIAIFSLLYQTSRVCLIWNLTAKSTWPHILCCISLSSPIRFVFYAVNECDSFGQVCAIKWQKRFVWGEMSVICLGTRMRGRGLVRCLCAIMNAIHWFGCH